MFMRTAIFGAPGPGWDDCCPVMFRHLLICLIEDCLTSCIFDDASLEIIRSEYPGDAAKEALLWKALWVLPPHGS